MLLCGIWDSLVIHYGFLDLYFALTTWGYPLHSFSHCTLNPTRWVVSFSCYWQVAMRNWVEWPGSHSYYRSDLGDQPSHDSEYHTFSPRVTCCLCFRDGTLQKLNQRMGGGRSSLWLSQIFVGGWLGFVRGEKVGLFWLRNMFVFSGFSNFFYSVP